MTSKLRSVKSKHPRSLFFGHININSVRNKFYIVTDILGQNFIDILAITETKLDVNFPNN